MWLGTFGSSFGQSVCPFIARNADMGWYPLQHHFVVLGKGAEAAVELAGGDVHRSGHQGLKGRQRVSEEHKALPVVVVLCQLLGCCSKGMEFSSVVGAPVSSGKGEGGSGTVRAPDVNTTTSIPY